MRPNRRPHPRSPSSPVHFPPRIRGTGKTRDANAPLPRAMYLPAAVLPTFVFVYTGLWLTRWLRDIKLLSRLTIYCKIEKGGVGRKSGIEIRGTAIKCSSTGRQTVTTDFNFFRVSFLEIEFPYLGWNLRWSSSWCRSWN